jgi:CDP-diacylglycerol---glycerol-3-phosphate 3-phosphatidyltransferase
LIIVLAGAGLSDLPFFPMPPALPVAMWLLAVASMITCAQRLHTVRHSPAAATPLPPSGKPAETGESEP